MKRSKRERGKSRARPCLPASAQPHCEWHVPHNDLPATMDWSFWYCASKRTFVPWVGLCWVRFVLCITVMYSLTHTLLCFHHSLLTWIKSSPSLPWTLPVLLAFLEFFFAGRALSSGLSVLAKTLSSSLCCCCMVYRTEPKLWSSAQPGLCPPSRFTILRSPTLGPSGCSFWSHQDLSSFSLYFPVWYFIYQAHTINVGDTNNTLQIGINIKM